MTETELLQKEVPVLPARCDVSEIHQEYPHKKVQIIYRDGSKIEQSEEEVADAVRQSHVYKMSLDKMQKTIETQLYELSSRLQAWCNANAEHLSYGIVAYGGVSRKNCFDVHFFAVQNSNTYSDEFSENLSQLEIEVEDSEQFSFVDMKVLELPNMDEERIRKFVNNFITSL